MRVSEDSMGMEVDRGRERDGCWVVEELWGGGVEEGSWIWVEGDMIGWLLIRVKVWVDVVEGFEGEEVVVCEGELWIEFGVEFVVKEGGVEVEESGDVRERVLD